MNLAFQRRRLVITLAVTAGSVIVALASIVASFGFHAAWANWVFVAALVIGFASHGWLMLGVARDKARP